MCISVEVRAIQRWLDLDRLEFEAKLKPTWANDNLSTEK